MKAHPIRHRDATKWLRVIFAANRRGKGVGVYSICSANRFVLEAAMLQAARDSSLLLIESTSNQVNQFGGYTGHTPADFARFVHKVAKAMRFPRQRIVLGGDHLGPHVWRNETSGSAMEKAGEMVRAYVRAGFTKIHLDTSMPCGDDKLDRGHALSDEIVSSRAAELCEAAEEARHELPRGAVAPLYVIGTEVPIPGGEQSGSAAPKVTRSRDLARTLAVARTAFRARGLHSAWHRVIAVVVQPGVEFGDADVFPYNARNARPLSRFLARNWTGVYEAHSTDYQTSIALRHMVADHFAILKVGPWLTFAFREAVFALENVEREWLSGRVGITLSSVQRSLEQAMIESPVHWTEYYQGDECALRIARKYSLSDRARYYWPQPAVAAAVQRLMDNLSTYPAPLPLLSQCLPQQAEAIRAGTLAYRPADIIRHKILQVLDIYAYACGMRRDEFSQERGRYAE